MKVIPMHQAKSSLSQLVNRAEAGETIFIGAYGKAQAKIVPAGESVRAKRIGVLKGKIVIPDDFDEELSESIISEFEK